MLLRPEIGTSLIATHTQRRREPLPNTFNLKKKVFKYNLSFFGLFYIYKKWIRMQRSLGAFANVFMCLLQVVTYIQLVIEAYMTIGQKIRLQYVCVFCFHF